MKQLTYLFTSILMGTFTFFTLISCEKEEDEIDGYKIYRYWENKGSYIKCGVPEFYFQLNKVSRTENDELEILYTLTNRGFDYNVEAGFYTSEFNPSIQDDTGRTYFSRNSYSDCIYYSIGGKTFDIFGSGADCIFRPNAPNEGRILVRNFTQSATSVWVTICIRVSEPYKKTTLEFINVPIEDGRTNYVVINSNR